MGSLEEKRRERHSHLKVRDFPGGSVVKNLPTIVGDTGSIPGLGTEIPHATGQLGPHTTTTQPALLSPGAAKTAHVLQLMRPSL